MSYRSTHGFNLIELVTVLLIASIIILIATPQLTSLNQSIRAASSIRTIQSSIQLARNLAINYGVNVTVCPVLENQCASNWQSGFTIFTDTGQKNVIDGADLILHEVSPFHYDDIVQYNRSSIRFKSTGLASGTNGTLTYCPVTFDSQYSKAVIINQAGRIRFSKKKNISCKQ
ncbi:GspH/FimT family protein [uncultured Shewanella sp.]|uniref:GspH/FimT family pseudopilin n=1 Tax=uncultured Shewanella sp. TaxID=173975 RepID=UPI00261CB6A0|nr:GspH/FimT family protein [uncultured Shewanella sp.]